MNKRFIPVYEDMMEGIVFADSDMFKTLVWILGQVRFKDTVVLVNNTKVKLKRGEALIKSRMWASEILNLSEGKYRRIIKELEDSGYIKISSTNKYSIIKPLKWSHFEPNKHKNNQQTSNNTPLEYQHSTNSYINIKDNKRNIKEFNSNKSMCVPTPKSTKFRNFEPSSDFAIDTDWEKENLRKQLLKQKETAAR